MSFEKKLNSHCKKCKPQTIKVYLSGTRRLLRLTDPDATEIPKTSKWLMSKSLEKKVTSLPLNKRRHLSSIAYIASKAYGLNEDNKWKNLMLADVASYQAQRDKNKKSNYEEENLPGSMKEFVKAGKDYFSRVKRVYAKDKPTLADLYKVQKWIVLRLATELPFRNDLPTINIESKTGNYLDKHKTNGLKIVMQNFKVSEKIGKREIVLSRSATTVLKKFIKYRGKAGISHDFLLSARNGNKMSKKGYSQMLIKTTSELMGKKVGMRIIRVLTATENQNVIDKANELTNKLLHTSKQTSQYVRK
jgi:hypothetical protein